MSQNTLFKTVMTKAENDPRIRLVILNGSHAHQTNHTDQYSDLDVAYYVLDITAVLNDVSFFQGFGEVLISQSKDEQLFKTPSTLLGHIHMMQFTDGTRLDLRVIDVSDLALSIQDDDYYQLLLDKDDRLAKVALPNAKVFPIKQPSEPYFKACVKRFYWLAFYVRKACLRHSIIEAQSMLNLMRESLEALMAWDAGINHGFDIELGKGFRYGKSNLIKTHYDQLIKTYPKGDAHAIIAAMGLMFTLFEPLSQNLQRHFNYDMMRNVKDVVGWLQADLKNHGFTLFHDDEAVMK